MWLHGSRCLVGSVRRTLFWLGGIVPLAVAAAPTSWAVPVETLSNNELAAVSGGSAGNCCIAGSLGCAGWTNGCQNSKYKCSGANSCPVGNQQIKQNIYGSMYEHANCNAATGDQGTMDRAPIDCTQTITCPGTCTKNGAYYYCDAGGNAQADPQITPTYPDNIWCD